MTTNVDVGESSRNVEAVNDEVKKNDEEVANITNNPSDDSTKPNLPNGNGTPPSRMTLQLILPSDDTGLYESLQYKKSSRPPSRTGSYLESKSPGFINTRLVNYNRPLSHQPSLRSVRSQQHLSSNEPEHHVPPPTAEEEKSKFTRKYFSTVTTLSYTIFLVVFALIVFIGTNLDHDLGHDFYPAAEVFCIVILTIGFAFFIYLYIDIRLHVKQAQNAVIQKEERIRIMQEQLARTEEHIQNSFELSQMTNNGNNNNVQLQIPLPNIRPIKPIPHRYCFQTGRHGEFLYLKMGAAWFAFGLLTHSVLTLSYQFIYFTEEPECTNIPLLVVEIMFPVYSLLVLFFVFKYCNVIINSHIGLARFGLMHAIGTSLAFWIYTIVRETRDAILMKSYKTKDKTDIEFLISSRNDSHERYAYTTYNTNECPGPEDLNTIYRTFSPYLYPFIIEFCILIVGIYYMIWSNINHCPKKLSASGHGHGDNQHQNNSTKFDSLPYTSLSMIPEEQHEHMPNGGGLHRSPSDVSDHCNNLLEHENQYKSNIVVHADCHAASRGLFAGLVLMILTIVFIILLHVAANEPEYFETGRTINSSFELSVLVVMIVTTIIAYVQTSKLDINLHPISKLDDFLLFIAIPAFFSETIFSFVPAAINGSVLNILIISTQIIQVLIQTPWICDALRRCANTEEAREKAPGRELVTFLTIANVSLWVFYTFSVKNSPIKDERYYFYGDRAWSILNHLSLPLIMFYRFHASVCLVDIWRHSYEPGEFAH